jgi:hypothetical protein
MYVPSSLTGFVGRVCFRIVRRVPLVFAIVAIGGLVLGYCCVFVFHDNVQSKEWFLRILGIGCFVFYGWLLTLLIWKLINKSWRDFCDWAIAIFEQM